MKRYIIPNNCKEITVNEDGELVYLKTELIEIKPREWSVVKSWQLLEELKNG